MNIIVGNNPKGFHPHFNRATWKYYGNEKDYKDDIRRLRLEPYTGDKPRPDARKYKPSKWAYDMAGAIKRHTDKDGNVHLSGAMKDELRKAGVRMPRRVDSLADGVSTKEGKFF